MTLENPIETRRTFDEIRKIILQKIIADPDLITTYVRVSEKRRGKLTVENLDTAACNHLFDTKPELFGISKKEAVIFREFFHENSYKKSILNIKDGFEDFFDEEDEGYLNSLK